MNILGKFFSNIFKRASETRGETENWLGAIRQSKVFRDLPEDTLTEMSSRLEVEHHKSGDVIIREGDEGEHFYVIESGRCRVTRRTGGGNEELAEIGAGTGFGEEALISNNKRNATVTMIEAGKLLRLGRDDFNELIKEPKLNWISRVQAQQAIQEGAVWLDVRSETEFARGSLTGAVSVPLARLRIKAAELDRNVSYICCCRNGRQSAAAAFILEQMGFKVCVLRGGLQRLPGFES